MGDKWGENNCEYLSRPEKLKPAQIEALSQQWPHGTYCLASSSLGRLLERKWEARPPFQLRLGTQAPPLLPRAPGWLATDSSSNSTAYHHLSDSMASVLNGLTRSNASADCPLSWRYSSCQAQGGNQTSEYEDWCMPPNVAAHLLTEAKMDLQLLWKEAPLAAKLTLIFPLKVPLVLQGSMRWYQILQCWTIQLHLSWCHMYAEANRSL